MGKWVTQVLGSVLLVGLVSGCLLKPTSKAGAGSKGSVNGTNPPVLLDSDLILPGEAIPVFSSQEVVRGAVGISGASWDFGYYGLSGDGEHLVFTTEEALTVEPSVQGTGRVYKKNVRTGGLTLVSRDIDGNSRDVVNSSANLSRNGRYAVFTGTAAFNVPEIVGYSGSMVWRADLETGELKHVSTDGETSPYIYPELSQVSDDGRFVVYRRAGLIYRRDMAQSTAEVVSRSPDQSQILSSEMSGSGMVSMSGDGQKVVFMVPNAADFVSGASGNRQVIFVDLVTQQRKVVSASASGQPAQAGFHGGELFKAKLSSDGSKVFFEGYSSNLIPGLGSAAAPHIFRKDVSTGEVLLVSSDSSGDPLTSGGSLGGVSDDGRFVCLSTQEDSTQPGVSGFFRVKVKDLAAGKLVDIEYGPNGENLNSGAHRSLCSLSGDGRFAVITVHESGGRIRTVYRQIRK